MEEGALHEGKKTLEAGINGGIVFPILVDNIIGGSVGICVGYSLQVMKLFEYQNCFFFTLDKFI
jgi:hypothetical protein